MNQTRARRAGQPGRWVLLRHELRIAVTLITSLTAAPLVWLWWWATRPWRRWRARRLDLIADRYETQAHQLHSIGLVDAAEMAAYHSRVNRDRARNLRYR